MLLPLHFVVILGNTSTLSLNIFVGSKRFKHFVTCFDLSDFCHKIFFYPAAEIYVEGTVKRDSISLTFSHLSPDDYFAVNNIS